MTRLTPRTCLWPLTGSLVITFALSIGLTFRSDHHCYAGTCGEWLFPLQARIHIIVWYFAISLAVTFLAVRAFHPEMRRHLRKPLFDSKIPILSKKLTISGVLAIFSVLALYGTLVGVWWTTVEGYFVDRGEEGHISTGNIRLAAIALTGHLCDVTMGMVLLPISRHSSLVSFFKLSASTSYAFHMITAYVLFALVLIHGCLYASWIPTYNSLSDALRKVYPVLNPTYLYHETWPGNTTSLGIWRASLIFTGSATALIMVVLFFTSLPWIRRKHFNIFYFTHLTGIVAVVVICLHASTMFYCLAPGLAMWLLDWLMRIYELRLKLDGKIVSIGNGWYCLFLELPRHRLDGCACTSPLAHFYIHHSESSVRELHPFTTITHLASRNAITPPSKDGLLISFLFRKRNKSAVDMPTRKHSWLRGFGLWNTKATTSQWTDKIASVVNPKATMTSVVQERLQAAITLNELDSSLIPPSSASIVSNRSSTCTSIPAIDIGLRLEGPYFTPSNPSRFRTVICFVAGTGVSGAISIASAFSELHLQCEPIPTDESGGNDTVSQPLWQRCVIFWTVKEEDYVDLPFIKADPRLPNLQIHINRTGRSGGGRLNITEKIREVIGNDQTLEDHKAAWVYLSGPNAFVASGEEACKTVRGLQFYGAKYG